MQLMLNTETLVYSPFQIYLLYDRSLYVFAGFPIRLDKRPLGPRDTPQFAKKQEYL